jgi:hypothetical protein
MSEHVFGLIFFDNLSCGFKRCFGGFAFQQIINETNPDTFFKKMRASKDPTQSQVRIVPSVRARCGTPVGEKDLHKRFNHKFSRLLV